MSFRLTFEKFDLRQRAWCFMFESLFTFVVSARHGCDHGRTYENSWTGMTTAIEKASCQSTQVKNKTIQGLCRWSGSNRHSFREHDLSRARLTILTIVVRAAGLEPAQQFLAEGFSYLLRLSPPSPAHSCNGSVWGLDYPFTVARVARCRCCPSSLYTFPSGAFAPGGLARDCL
jgi:hypothetical protein